jgi:predicted Zn-dependent peptidase
MIHFEKHTLANGLRVIVHPDSTTPLAAVNLLYQVGAKDEDPQKTGFAHLFEHLMFGGSKHIPSYDEPLQKVGGDNNAWTSNDMTNYYQTLPADNIETALWLESDRMLELDFSQQSLDIQKKVVIEEFKQQYINQPYGDIPHLIRPLAYTHHPYQWPTIGKEISHIENASLMDVKDFFFHHYAPNNAILSVTGHVVPEQVFKLAEKWFTDIPSRCIQTSNIPTEPVQSEKRMLEVERPVPAHLIQMVFHIGKRTDDDFYTVDLLSDILSNGASSRLIQSLVKDQKLFADINAYISGDLHPGLFTITGRLTPDTSLSKAEDAIWTELRKIANDGTGDYELQKVKNKVESNLVFSEISFLNKAMTLAQFELSHTNAGQINQEVDLYRLVTREKIRESAQTIFRPENVSVLYYKAKQDN